LQYSARRRSGIDVGEVEVRIDALGDHQVHRQGDDVDVAGAFAVAEQGALDSVGAGQQPHLGGSGHRAAAVVVRVQADSTTVTNDLRIVTVEPLDHVGVHIGRVASRRWPAGSG
jgi:hypothetical protein